VTKQKDIVVVGASAGGLAALQRLVGDLPQDFSATIFIVLHMSPSSPSLLADILQRCTSLPVSQGEDGDRIRGGSIVVARPDYHLVVEPDKIRLTRGPKENRSRPAIDALFRSAAYSYAARVVGVILTGALDDGTAGLWSIKDRGGTAIIQDPADAAYPSMPDSAIKYVGADHVVPIAEMATLLHRLSREPAGAGKEIISNELEVENTITKEGRALQAGVMDLGPITPYTCPECHGVLVQLKEGGVPRFRCHTGHAYSINNLLAEVTEYVEDALWNAIRAIEESAMLLNQLGDHRDKVMHDRDTAKLFYRKAEDTTARADLVRRATMAHQTLSEDNVAEVKTTSR
jgi:two-component system chemotaxis response regulator CheB